MSTTPTSPTPPIELNGATSQFEGVAVEVPEEALAALTEVCEVITDSTSVAEASRDWWPLALHWSLAGKVPRMAEVVARPSNTGEVEAVV